MATFGAVKTAIARRLLDENNTAVTDVEIGEAINEAIKKWKSKRFWFNTTDFDLAIAAGDDTLTLPADFLVEIPRNAVTVVESGMVRQVKKKSPTVFDGYANQDATGLPLIYTSRDGELEIYPPANTAYAGKLYYLKDYDVFATNGDDDAETNDFLDDGQQLIQNEALANLHGELRQDEKMEARYAARAQDEYETLRTRTALMNRSGTLTVEQ
jgi:hypothetical protein